MGKRRKEFGTERFERAQRTHRRFEPDPQPQDLGSTILRRPARRCRHPLQPRDRLFQRLHISLWSTSLSLCRRSRRPCPAVRRGCGLHRPAASLERNPQRRRDIPRQLPRHPPVLGVLRRFDSEPAQLGPCAVGLGGRCGQLGALPRRRLCVSRRLVRELLSPRVCIVGKRGL